MRKISSLAPVVFRFLFGLGCGALLVVPAAHADILLLGAITNAVQNPPVPPPDYSSVPPPNYSTNGYGTASGAPGYSTNASSASTNLPDYSRTVSSNSATAPATSYPASASSSYASPPPASPTGPIIITTSRPSMFAPQVVEDTQLYGNQTTLPQSYGSVDNMAILPVPMILMPPAPPYGGNLVGAPPAPFIPTPTGQPSGTAAFGVTSIGVGFAGPQPGLSSGSAGIAGPPPAPATFTRAPGSR